MPPGWPPGVFFGAALYFKSTLYSHWSRQSLWEAEPGAGSQEGWKGTREPKIIPEEEGAAGLPGTQQLTHPWAGLSGPLKQMLSLSHGGAHAAFLAPLCCPCPCPCPGMPGWCRLHLAVASCWSSGWLRPSRVLQHPRALPVITKGGHKILRKQSLKQIHAIGQFLSFFLFFSFKTSE